jgi:hypothetical protein
MISGLHNTNNTIYPRQKVTIKDGVIQRKTIYTNSSGMEFEKSGLGKYIPKNNYNSSWKMPFSTPMKSSTELNLHQHQLYPMEDVCLFFLLLTLLLAVFTVGYILGLRRYRKLRSVGNVNNVGENYIMHETL